MSATPWPARATSVTPTFVFIPGVGFVRN
jgi:hypothetical protein